VIEVSRNQSWANSFLDVRIVGTEYGVQALARLAMV